MWRALTLWGLLLPSSYAAVYGLTEPPTPAPYPTWWFAFSDDFLGMAVLNTDDYRTANVTTGGRFSAWRWALDWSMLTNRGRDGSAASRSDELIYSLGYALVDEEWTNAVLRPSIVVGAGGRTYGNLGGESVQNRVHKTAGYPQLFLPYDDAEGSDGLVFMHQRLTWEPESSGESPGLFGHWDGQQEGGGFISTDGAFHGFISARIISHGRDAETWCGVRYQWLTGNEPTPTSELVARKESGWWIDAGLARRPGIFVVASINPSRESVAGSAGITIDPPLYARADVAQPVEIALKLFLGAGNLGADIRWRPGWLREHSPFAQDHLLLVYDFGTVQKRDNWTDNTPTFDQIIAGYGPAWNIIGPQEAISLTALSYVAGGLRFERVQESRANPRFPDTGIHTAAVGQSGVSLRCGFRLFDDPKFLANQFRLGVGADGWFPFPTRTITRGADSSELFIPGAAWYITLGTQMLW
jgi:hypothetical protein